VLPLAEEVSMNKEVGVLIEGLHTSECWPILVYDFSCKMKGNMYTEIHQHSSYILILGLCKEWEKHISHFWQQLYELSLGNNMWHSRNARAKFVVCVMSNCTLIGNTKVLKAILKELWVQEVMNSAVVFLKSNEHGGNDL
jgi:hypothetical protein